MMGEYVTVMFLGIDVELMTKLKQIKAGVYSVSVRKNGSCQSVREDFNVLDKCEKFLSDIILVSY